MFKVDASTVNEYFSADPAREADLRAVDRLIRSAAPALKRQFFGGTPGGRPGMSMRLVGYGLFQYHVKASAQPIDWPVIGLALQKNHLSLYVAAVEDGAYVVERFAGRLGKVSLGRNNIRFRTYADLGHDGLTDLVRYVGDGIVSGRLELRYGRVQ
ncbi:DUF1801 domain-containing protein [Fodinicola acaciae]|uniref:DUF1801 domain-containing protein n=1 Tax=Fodinicola acaciae TaxID=2681555 RepID=UPI0013D39318|nr:DUF1801 domain-containing protein [Fodinicola acaciae]